MARRKDADGRAVDHEKPVDERVRTIRRMMAVKAWKPEVIDLLAEEWQLSPTTVRCHAAEASRQLEALLDADQARSEIADMLAEARARASQEPEHARASLALSKAAESSMKLHGIGAHRRATETKAAAGTPASTLPPDVAELSQCDEALTFWSVIGRRPTRDQLEAMKGGASYQQVAQDAGLWPPPAAPPASSGS